MWRNKNEQKFSFFLFSFFIAGYKKYPSKSLSLLCFEKMLERKAAFFSSVEAVFIIQNLQPPKYPSMSDKLDWTLKTTGILSPNHELNIYHD